jgi:dTDP-glucose pyrophosphorylase
MTLIIPMAGLGSRFADAGYSFPKPLIPVPPYETMIEMVIRNLDYDGQHIFLVQQAHIDEFHIDKTLKLLKPDCIIVPVNGLTEGAACTILLAEPYLDLNDELVIANSDQFVPNFDMRGFLDKTIRSTVISWRGEREAVSGGIVIFDATHPKWSFVKLGDQDRVIQVAEKNPISNHATAGVYAFHNAEDFILAAKQMIGKNIRTNGEFYLAPVFNEFIELGRHILPYQVEKIYGTGTPEDLQAFLNRETK